MAGVEMETTKVTTTIKNFQKRLFFFFSSFLFLSPFCFLSSNKTISLSVHCQGPVLFGFAVFAWFILFLITTGGNCLAEFVARGMAYLTFRLCLMLHAFYSLCGVIRGLA